MRKDTIEMTRNNRTDFARMKSVLACASKDMTRYAITKVLVRKAESGVILTATDGRRLRMDHFDMEASAGLYDIKTNSGSSIFLMRNKERLTFPKVEAVIPSLAPKDAVALNGTGRRFVLWAAAAQGCMITPELVELPEDEAVTLYIQREHPEISPAVVKTDQTTLILMPFRVEEAWVDELRHLRMAKAA